VSADGGNKGSMNAQCASVKSDGYGFLFSVFIRAFSAQLAFLRDQNLRFYSEIRIFIEF
jgi:hypothetical protein